MEKEKTKVSRVMQKQRRIVSHRKHQIAYQRSMLALGVKPVPGWEDMTDAMMEKEVDRAFITASKWRQRKSLRNIGLSRKAVRLQMRKFAEDTKADK